MDSRKNDFFASPGGKLPGLGEGAIQWKAAASPPGVRNDTVGAERITSILNFKEGSGPIRKQRKPSLFKSPQLTDLRIEEDALGDIPPGRNDFRNFPLFVDPYDEIHSGNGPERLRRYLGVTTGDNELGGWILCLRPPDELTGLRIGPLGDGTGMDDGYIGIPGRRDNSISLSRELRSQGGRITLVGLTSESKEGNF